MCNSPDLSEMSSKTDQTLCRCNMRQKEESIIISITDKLIQFVCLSVCPAADPDVYIFVKASGSSEQQVLMCLATGFYPKYVHMEIRHDWTPLPDEQLHSHGIRPNADGSFELMKSLEILLCERCLYYYVVNEKILPDEELFPCSADHGTTV